MSREEPNRKNTSLFIRFAMRAKTERHMEKKHYASYLGALLRENSLYVLLQKLIHIMKRFKLVSWILKAIGLTVWLLEAVFLLTLIFVFLIPPLLVLLILLLLILPIVYTKENKRLRRELAGKHIIVFFPTREGELAHGEFWKANITELSTKDHTVVLIVSPFFLSSIGPFDTARYLLCRRERESVYLIRRYYYFSMKKHILPHGKRTITVF